MRKRFIVSIAAALLALPQTSIAATFYAYSSSGGDFAYVSAAPLTSLTTIAPDACQGLACNYIDVNNAGGTATVYYQLPVKSYDQYGHLITKLVNVQDITNFDPNAFSSPGFYTGIFQSATGAQSSRANLTVFDIPSYEKGSYVYAYSSSAGSFAYVSAAPLMGLTTIAPDACQGLACNYIDINNAGGTTTVNYQLPVKSYDQYGHLITKLVNVQDITTFDPNAFSSPGFYTGIFQSATGAQSSGANLTVFALPDAFATSSAVPEPMTWVLMLSGVGMIGAVMRRTKAQDLLLQ